MQARDRMKFLYSKKEHLKMSANNILNGEIVKAFPLRSDKNAQYLHF